MREVASMKRHLFSGAGPTLDLEAVHVVALYDPDTGRIAHMHIVSMFAGGRAVSEKEAVEGAQQHAAHLGHRVQDLHVKVTSNPEHAQGSHRIDPRTGELIRLPDPELRYRGARPTT